MTTGIVAELVRAKDQKFEAGQIVMTAGVCERAAEDDQFAAQVQASLARHLSGDWGDLEEEDTQENEFSLDKYLRLFSSYVLADGGSLWIITEADRSVTTMLFPSEY